MTKSWVTLVLVAALAAGGGFWLGRPASPGEPPPKAGAGKPAVGVVVAQVQDAQWPRYVQAVGSLRADESVVIKPEVAGRIVALPFNEGAAVKRGDVLLRLDDAVLAAERQQAAANLALARSRHQRSLLLAHDRFISAQAADETAANLKAAQATHALATARLARAVVRAPFDGRIGLRRAAVGDYIKEGSEVVVLEKRDVLKVDFSVPESASLSIRPGHALQFQLDALPGRDFAGKVIAVDAAVTTTGRALAIRAQVDNAGGELLPGMFARVQLLLGEAQTVRVVPETALWVSGGAQTVFRVMNGKAVLTPVTPGLRQPGLVEIVHGLNSGDTVVIDGQLKLQSGSPVRPVPAVTAAAPV